MLKPVMREIHLQMDSKSKRLLLQILDDYQRNLPMCRPEAMAIAQIKKQVIKQWNEALPSMLHPAPNGDWQGLMQSLMELKQGNLGGVIGMTKDEQLVLITYDHKNGYTLKINTEVVLSDVHVRKIAFLFQALTVGACQS